MLKVSFVLDCDDCHAVFEQAIATDRTDTPGWWEAAAMVRSCAERSRWLVYGNDCLCPDCSLELQKQAEYFGQ